MENRVVGGRVYIETYGCAFNASDSEVMAGLLIRAGYEVVDIPETADAIIVNSCTVKDRTLLELRKRLKVLSSNRQQDNAPGAAVVLAGCVPRVYEHSREFAALAQIGPDNITDIPQVVGQALSGRAMRLTNRENHPRLNLPKRRRNPAVEIIPISKGCLGACTFCQTVIARGRLHSFPEEEILAQLNNAVREGVRVIWLTSQDCGAYGLDCGTNLPRLMRRIAAIPGNFKVRIGMANPDLVKLFLTEFVDALSHEKFFQFAHIPLQSGSDRVLAEMKRNYTSDDFRATCERLRARMPNVTLATDIIVGYPTEQDEDFEATVRLMKETAIPVMNRSRFSPRPGTSAARLALLPGKTMALRSRRLSELAIEIHHADAIAWIGRNEEMIIEENSRHGVALARNRAYKPVVVRGEFLPGEQLLVRVAGVEGFHFTGECVDR
jgi:MiaB-like tRNA modifying enzyme